MKHLKIFEKSPDYIKFYDLKKYVICENIGDDTYLALELIKSVDDFKIIVQTLAFSKKNNNFAKSAEIKISESTIRNRIIFQSDDINEIITQLELFKNAKQYNI